MGKLAPAVSAILVATLIGYLAASIAQSTPAQSLSGSSAGQAWYASPVPTGSFVSHPRNWVEIREGTDYLVPTGKIFVLTALGGYEDRKSAGPWFLISEDGGNTWDPRLQATWDFEKANGMSMKEVPIGMAVDQGKLIRLQHVGLLIGRAWGYLIDA